MEWQPQAAERQDGTQTGEDQSEFAFSEKGKPKDKCYKKEPNTVPIIVLIKASASRHYKRQAAKCEPIVRTTVSLRFVSAAEEHQRLDASIRAAEITARRC